MPLKLNRRLDSAATPCPDHPAKDASPSPRAAKRRGADPAYRAASVPGADMATEIQEEAALLRSSSRYPCSFDYGVYHQLAERFRNKAPRGGYIFQNPFKLINYHYACQECLYAFMLDTYGRGCTFNCLYCYARCNLITHGYWNRPFPMPLNINAVRKAFYTVFETNKRFRWRPIMEQRIPLRIGYASDSFMHMDKKYKVTQELLKILKYYQYPYIIATRSDLVGDDLYLSLLDNKLAAVQLSIISTNPRMNKILEPGAPPVAKRLRALQKLKQAGFWTTVRINPVFPLHPDGYYSDEHFAREKRGLKLEVFSWEMIEELAAHGVPAIIVGFGRFFPYALNQMSEALGVDVRQFFNGKKFEGCRDYHFSDAEIRYYYQRIKGLCAKHNIQFTTCYIANGEYFFWKDQDLWDNQADCCQAVGHVAAFTTHAQRIPFAERLKFATSCLKPDVPERDKINISDYLAQAHFINNPFIDGAPK
jgi:DNA repair photolyase